MIEIIEFVRKLNFNYIIFFIDCLCIMYVRLFLINIMYKILNMCGLNVVYRGIYGYMYVECILEKEFRSVDFFCIFI